MSSNPFAPASLQDESVRAWIERAKQLSPQSQQQQQQQATADSSTTVNEAMQQQHNNEANELANQNGATQGRSAQPSPPLPPKPARLAQQPRFQFSPSLSSGVSDSEIADQQLQQQQQPQQQAQQATNSNGTTTSLTAAATPPPPPMPSISPPLPPRKHVLLSGGASMPPLDNHAAAQAAATTATTPPATTATSPSVESHTNGNSSSPPPIDSDDLLSAAISPSTIQVSALTDISSHNNNISPSPTPSPVPVETSPSSSPSLSPQLSLPLTVVPSTPLSPTSAELDRLRREKEREQERERERERNRHRHAASMAVGVPQQPVRSVSPSPLERMTHQRQMALQRSYSAADASNLNLSPSPSPSPSPSQSPLLSPNAGGGAVHGTTPSPSWRSMLQPSTYTAGLHPSHSLSDAQYRALSVNGSLGAHVQAARVRSPKSLQSDMNQMLQGVTLTGTPKSATKSNEPYVPSIPSVFPNLPKSAGGPSNATSPSSAAAAASPNANTTATAQPPAPAPPLRLFENFLVLGCSPTPAKLAENLTSWTEKAKILLKFPHHSSIEAADIADFAFPSDVRLVRIDVTQSATGLHSILYGQRQFQRGENCHTFLFKLANPDNPAESEDMYGVCVAAREMASLVGPDGATHDISCPISYCIISKYPFFELHQGVILQILMLLHLKRVKHLGKLAVESPESVSKLRGKPLGPHQVPACVNLLKHFYEAIVPEKGKILQLPAPKLLEPLRFQRPSKGKNEVNTLVMQWCSVLAWRNLSAEQIVDLLEFGLREMKIIVIETNLAMLSSAIMAYWPLLHPLKWSGIFLPILPNKLSEFLEAPVPIIAGVTELPNSLDPNQLTGGGDENTVVWFPLQQKFCVHKRFQRLFPARAALVQALKPHVVELQKIQKQLLQQITLGQNFSGGAGGPPVNHHASHHHATISNHHLGTAGVLAASSALNNFKSSAVGGISSSSSSSATSVGSNNSLPPSYLQLSSQAAHIQYQFSMEEQAHVKIMHHLIETEIVALINYVRKTSPTYVNEKGEFVGDPKDKKWEPFAQVFRETQMLSHYLQFHEHDEEDY